MLDALQFCIMDESTKHIHAQRFFRFLAERHKTLANWAQLFERRLALTPS